MTEPPASNAPPAAPLPAGKARLTARLRSRAINTARSVRSFARRSPSTLRSVWQTLRPIFTERSATFKVTVIPLILLSVLVYTRSLWTNYIFDEQEALLANPYVNGDSLKLWQIVERDFWGHPANRTVGSYRPLPNVFWRWLFLVRKHAWPPHFLNVLLHGLNGALMATFVFHWTNNRRSGWFAGLAFTLGAVVTEAVCAVVGLADVLSGTFILLCLNVCRLKLVWQAPLMFVYGCLGFLCKEAMLTVLPMFVLAALCSAPIFHPAKPQRLARLFWVGVGSMLALVAYTYFRRHFFQITIPDDYKTSLPATEPYLKRLMHEFLRWFQQLKFIADPFNNPLGQADPTLRIAGALRVYFRGLIQIVFPWQLSGDYSFPQEPVPAKAIFFESIMGALTMVGPPLLGIGLYLRGIWYEFRRRFDATFSLNGSTQATTWLDDKARILPLLTLCLVWVPFTFFPQSNIPVVLPTVRAERFWYIPLVGTSMLVGCAINYLWNNAAFRNKTRWAAVATLVFFGFQAGRARAHAFDYRNDLIFWKQTAKAVPNSAKAHLNYGVMLGARNDLPGRLVENGRALELAPEWPMANIYYGDTLCRLHRADEAFPHYANGFNLGPNQQMLVSLALQCLWDEKVFEKHKPELEQLSEKHKGSWVAFLVNDMKSNGVKHNGVDPKYRSRGYNGGPRQD